MKTVIEMAREAGSFIEIESIDYIKFIERFAALVREDEREKQQEPVAWMEDSIEFYAKDHPTSTCTIPLYTTPLTAALAARQMRDAAVKVCRLHIDDTVYNVGMGIAHLPVPEVQWRDLTDDDYAWLLKNNRIFDFQARAVIAKFKEKQL